MWRWPALSSPHLQQVYSVPLYLFWAANKKFPDIFPTKIMPDTWPSCCPCISMYMFIHVIPRVYVRLPSFYFNITTLPTPQETFVKCWQFYYVLQMKLMFLQNISCLDLLLDHDWNCILQLCVSYLSGIFLLCPFHTFPSCGEIWRAWTSMVSTELHNKILVNFFPFQMYFNSLSHSTNCFWGMGIGNDWNKYNIIWTIFELIQS